MSWCELLVDEVIMDPPVEPDPDLPSAAELLAEAEDLHRCTVCLVHNTRLPEWCPHRQDPCIVRLRGHRAGEVPGPRES